MNSGDLALALCVAAVTVELFSIFYLDKRLQREHNFMLKRGTAGEQLGEWLLYSEVEGEPRNIEVLTGMVASQLSKTQKFSDMQAASVDSRIANKYDTKIVEGLQKKMPVGWKIILKACDYFGFDVEEIMEKGELTQLMSALQRNEVGVLMGTEMNPGSAHRGGKNPYG